MGGQDVLQTCPRAPTNFSGGNHVRLIAMPQDADFEMSLALGVDLGGLRLKAEYFGKASARDFQNHPEPHTVPI